jgi:hypothetical protein
VNGLDVVDLGHGISVDRDVKLPLREAEDRVDRHFEVGVLVLLSDQDVVRVDLPHIPEVRAVEADHRGSQRDVARTMWIVGHSQLLRAGLTVADRGSPALDRLWSPDAICGRIRMTVAVQ